MTLFGVGKFTGGKRCIHKRSVQMQTTGFEERIDFIACFTISRVFRHALIHSFTYLVLVEEILNNVCRLNLKTKYKGQTHNQKQKYRIQPKSKNKDNAKRTKSECTKIYKKVRQQKMSRQKKVSDSTIIVSVLGSTRSGIMMSPADLRNVESLSPNLALRRDRVMSPLHVEH